MQTIWKQIAMETQSTPEEVRREIQAAIQVGLTNEDPEVRRQWKRLVGNEKNPSPEKVIAGITALVLKELAQMSDEQDMENFNLSS